MFNISITDSDLDNLIIKCQSNDLIELDKYKILGLCIKYKLLEAELKSYKNIHFMYHSKGLND